MKDTHLQPKCVCVLGFSTDAEAVRCRRGGLWQEVAHVLMETEEAHSPLCTLETRGSQGRPSAQKQRPENWGGVASKPSSLKAWEPGTPVSEGRGRSMSQLKNGEFALPPACRSARALNGPDGAHLPWWAWSSSLRPLIQMLISSGSTLTDTPKNNVFPTLCTPPSAVKLTHKITHHSILQLRVGKMWAWTTE